MIRVTHLKCTLPGPALSHGVHLLSPGLWGGSEAVLVLLKNILCSRNERKEVKQELKDVGYVRPCKKDPIATLVGVLQR